MGIPDTVMGLTFVAAGVSIPDILTSLAVAREGLFKIAFENLKLKCDIISCMLLTKLF